MRSQLTPAEVNKFLGHARLAKVGKKNYFGREDGYNILCTCRHPREAMTSHQNFGRSWDWKNILITKHGEVILSVYRDRLK